MEGKQDKKVLIFITKSNFGGAQKYVLELSKGLQNKGFNIKVALGGDGILIEKLSNSNISTITIKNLQRDVSFLKEIKSFFEILKIIKDERPDIIHLNSSKIGALGAFAGILAGVKKRVFTIHGWAFNENRNFISKSIIKMIYLSTLLCSTDLIAVSNETKKQSRKIPFSFLFNKKIKTIHNTISPIDFYDRNFARDKLGIAKDDFVIGTIAELHPIKNLKLLINSAREIDAKFVIIGDGEEREKLDKYIADNMLREKVSLLGFVDEGARYLKAFDIFTLTSKSEALALVVLEAGQAGLPIISSRVGGIPEIITDNETGILFESNNQEEFNTRLENLLKSEDKRTKFGIQIKEKVSEEFELDKMVDKVINIYNS